MSPFVTTSPVDMANTGMETPTDSPRTEDHAALLTEKQTCTYLNVSKRNLYCWRMAGLIPYFKTATDTLQESFRTRLNLPDGLFCPASIINSLNDN